ncbi:hypothetical protein [Nonomuraea soli]|uniref:Uncharacterized protein n=1 Tax=Nonomuraea soli TaxID=1032476 RepID=A0A7W0CU33_9ACTN|nr:hypothetical protein [Nonomuraea soli]MBA2897377.1 hypothetical protein [Nonomuraea soli]
MGRYRGPYGKGYRRVLEAKRRQEADERNGIAPIERTKSFRRLVETGRLKPVEVNDVNDWWPATPTPQWFNSIVRWFSAAKVEIDDTYRYEVYCVNNQLIARFFQYAREADGRVAVDLQREEICRRQPFLVAVDELPPPVETYVPTRAV